MSGTSELLAELRARNIELSAKEGKLKLSAPPDALTPELKERIVAHKAELLALLDAASEARAEGSRAALTRLPAGAPWPLSYVQERFYFLERVSPGTPVYNVGVALRWDGALVRERLERALSEIVRRHDVLRATFHEQSGVSLQRITDAQPVTLEAEPVEESALAHAIEQACLTPFDLATGPLYRFRLFALGERQHVLLVLAHHIVWDGRSSDLFRQELVTLYEQQSRGEAAELPMLRASYGDFAAHLRSSIERGELARSIAWWKQRMTPLPEPLDLPADRPRAEFRSSRGATFPFRFPPKLVAALRALARGQQATLQMVLLASLDVLLARFAGQPDVVVGLPYDQREQGDVGELIGCFVNTLALRVLVKNEEPFTALLARVREESLAALAHREVPFERVVEAVSPPRDPSRTPLYQVMFSFQEREHSEAAPSGVSLREMTLPTGGAASDLFIWVGSHESELSVAVDYASELFDRATIERLCGAWSTLLSAIVATPEEAVGRLTLLPSHERSQVVDDFNRTRADRQFGGRVHELVEAQVTRTPDATALVFEQQSLTYRELDARANRLARVLIARGVARGQLVGVAVARSLELPIALLAVLKAGAAYVPLDPNYPEERIRSMAEDAKVGLIVTDRESASRFSGQPLPLFVLEDEAERIATAEASSPAVSGDASDLMYVIYTSGSTGKPKGVMVEHRNVTNFFEGMHTRLTLDQPGTWLSATSASFDISVLEIFGSLSHGFKLVLVSFAHASGTDHSIAAELERHSVTHYQCTPSQALLLLGDVQARRALKSVREMLVGGEALGLDVARQLLDSISGRLLNMYGPTETTIWSSTFEVGRDTKFISLGRPIVNTSFYVLDALLQPVPIGVSGELFIGGLGVTRGYLNRDELTRERFIADPFEPGARLYRTGDLVRHRADGTLEFLGRNDFQVKVRGFRIELGEIEEALRTLAFARESVVIAKNDGRGDARLIAYLVPSANTPPEPRELRELLRARLPEHMLPSTFVSLSELPLTGSGKVDRNRLPAPEEQPVSRTAEAQPANELEQKIAGCWKAVLGREAIGVEDNFFDVGGHSLLMGRLAAELTESVGARVTIPELFQYPTVRALATQLGKGSKDGRADVQERASARRAAPRNTQGRRG
jgi:amino acid adenylation domain-containing protein